MDCDIVTWKEISYFHTPFFFIVESKVLFGVFFFCYIAFSHYSVMHCEVQARTAIVNCGIVTWKEISYFHTLFCGVNVVSIF